MKSTHPINLMIISGKPYLIMKGKQYSKREDNTMKAERGMRVKSAQIIDQIVIIIRVIRVCHNRYQVMHPTLVKSPLGKPQSWEVGMNKLPSVPEETIID